ncbi:MAG: glycosyltransferase [Candidatus Jordarchaeaceae archaeon]
MNYLPTSIKLNKTHKIVMLGEVELTTNLEISPIKRSTESNMFKDELPRISIILPVHNEAKVIEKNLVQIVDYVEKFFESYQIIVAEDGSNDATEPIAKRLAEINPRIIHIHSDTRLGKGRALKRAFKITNEKIVTFMDIDLASSLEQLPLLARMIEEGFTLALGSRSIKGSEVRRPPIRKMASKIYNLLVRLLFRDGIHDHQCGFKAFNRDLILPLLDEIKDNGFFFDTELIIRAKRRGHSIVEVPVEWEEPEGRESKFRLVRDGIKILRDLFKLRIALWMS